MIILNHEYTGILFSVEIDSDWANADDTLTGILYRNGSASGVTVYVEVVSEGLPGLYKARFTTLGTADGWIETDRLFLRVYGDVDGAEKQALVWDSGPEPYGLAPLSGTQIRAAVSAAVSETIRNSEPTDLKAV